jgi:predicted DNA-binding mobile mystery protein A
MTTTQFARRLGVSQPRIIELEKSEVSGSVTLRTLRRAAEALDCRLVYVLVPVRPLAAIVSDRAKHIADRQLASVEHTMSLEDQAVDGKKARADLRRQVIADLTQRPARLWDDK